MQNHLARDKRLLTEESANRNIEGQGDKGTEMYVEWMQSGCCQNCDHYVIISRPLRTSEKGVRTGIDQHLTRQLPADDQAMPPITCL